MKHYLEAISASIKASGNGIAMIHMTKERMEKLILPIPPFSEQLKIAAKIDELMALCDQLEQQTEDSITVHQTLVKTLLATLTSSENTEAFNENWARIAEHFDTLFTTDHSIDQLKQTVLHLAVMGKLVPQNPNDEPASVLLEKIAAEKEQLIKDKKIKKQKPLPAITKDEKPFVLPSGWEWCYLQDISSYIQRGKGPKYEDFGKVRVVSQKCIQWTGFNVELARYVNNDSLEKYQEERFLKSQDLLWNSTGTGTVGRINIIENIKERSLVADSHVTVIRTMLIQSNFVKNYIENPEIQQRIEPDHEDALVSGSTNQVELNTSAVISLKVPIPPLREQHRIVTKVDELMALCEQLKTNLSQAQATQLQLADAVVSDICGYQPSKSIESKAEAIIMKITTTLTLGEQYANQDDAILAALINKEGLKADAKAVWNKSKFDLPTFYKQLKKEINAGYINQPAQANFEN